MRERSATVQVDVTPTDSNPIYIRQNSGTLDACMPAPRERAAIIDTDLLRQPSVYRSAFKPAVRGENVTSESLLAARLAVLSATYRESAKPSGKQGCGEVALSVGQRLRIHPESVFEIMESELTASPDCACEIVKSAIRILEADPSLVASIVETSINAAPEHLRLISQCAIAEAPESLSSVQALLARLDPHGGGHGESSKSAKVSTDAIVDAVRTQMESNPLDLPAQPVVTPPLIMPLLVSMVNP